MRTYALIIALVGIVWILLSAAPESPLHASQWGTKWLGRRRRKQRRHRSGSSSSGGSDDDADRDEPRRSRRKHVKAVEPYDETTDKPRTVESPASAPAPAPAPAESSAPSSADVVEPNEEEDAEDAQVDLVRESHVSGEYMDMHSEIGLPRYRLGKASGGAVTSPNLHELDRQRLPAALAEKAGRNRLHRVVGIPTNSQYRSTTGQNSSFAHLR